MTIHDRKPLILPMVGEWLKDNDTEAVFTFEASPSLSMVELTIAWGPGPRQSRTWALEESDLGNLHEWLTAVLGWAS